MPTMPFWSQTPLTQRISQHFSKDKFRHIKKLSCSNFFGRPVEHHEDEFLRRMVNETRSQR